jgi:hypothetical protein
MVLNVYFIRLATISGDSSSLLLTSALICQSIAIAYSLFSATLPNLKSFIRSFHTAMMLDLSHKIRKPRESALSTHIRTNSAKSDRPKTSEVARRPFYLGLSLLPSLSSGSGSLYSETRSLDLQRRHDRKMEQRGTASLDKNAPLQTPIPGPERPESVLMVKTGFDGTPGEVNGPFLPIERVQLADEEVSWRGVVGGEYYDRPLAERIRRDVSWQVHVGQEWV